MKYISVSLYKKVITHAIKEGVPVDYFEKLNVPFSSLKEIQAVPADDFFDLHEQMDQKLGPGFAVRVGQQMKMDDYGVLGLSWKTCSRAGEIFERSERYFMLLSNTYLFKVEKEQEVSKIHLFRDGYRRGVCLSNEATFSAVVIVVKAMTATDVAPVHVSFQHAAPDQMDSYSEAFHCPVEFDQPHNFIAYKSPDLEMRSAIADASINKFLVERVEEATAGIEISAGKIVTDVQRLIRDALPSGIPSITSLGEYIGMSSRTLTRRLSEGGITFRDLIKKTQEEISKDLLRTSSRSVGEIAYQTGFSEQSAFNRAFKRWTGQSPIEFRKSGK